jgi:hypothetical protein
MQKSKCSLSRVADKVLEFAYAFGISHILKPRHYMHLKVYDVQSELMCVDYGTG